MSVESAKITDKITAIDDFNEEAFNEVIKEE